MDSALTRGERILARTLRVLAWLSAGGLAATVVAAAEYVIEPASVALAVFAGALLLAICAVAASDVRRFGPLAGIVALAMGVGGLMAAMLALPMSPASPTVAVAAGLVAAAGLVLWWLYTRARRERLNLRVLSPSAYAVLVTRADMAYRDRAVPLDDIARNADAVAGQWSRRQRANVSIALQLVAVMPLLRFRVPLPLMGPEDRRRWLSDRQRSEPARFAPLGGLMEATIRETDNLLAQAYYLDERATAEIGAVERREEE